MFIDNTKKITNKNGKEKISDHQTDLKAINAQFSKLEIKERIELINNLSNIKKNSDTQKSPILASSSAGAQSAVILHILSKYSPDTPVILIDTGYLFKETYEYFETLKKLFSNLKFYIYTPKMTAAMQEALYGKLWEQGEKGHQKYAITNKIEPMNRALHDHNSNAWISGLRRSQSNERKNFDFIMQQKKIYKIYPILDWTDQQISTYMLVNDLPHHPLVGKGYISIGDWHSTKSITEVKDKDKTRFDGQKRECGLHLESDQIDFQI